MQTDRGEATVSTWQDDDVWHLGPTEPTAFEPDGVYRKRETLDLPTGVFRHACLCLMDGGPVELHMAVGSRTTALVAGEAQEREEGLDYVYGDESVLVFSDPGSIAHVRWRVGSRGELVEVPL